MPIPKDLTPDRIVVNGVVSADTGPQPKIVKGQDTPQAERAEKQKQIDKIVADRTGR